MHQFVISKPDIHPVKAEFQSYLQACINYEKANADITITSIFNALTTLSEQEKILFCKMKTLEEQRSYLTQTTTAKRDRSEEVKKKLRTELKGLTEKIASKIEGIAHTQITNTSKKHSPHNGLFL